MALNLISDWRFCYELIEFYLASVQPVFLSRIGGSDTDAVVEYWHVKNSIEDRTKEEIYIKHLPLVQKFNGYYDRRKSIEKFFNYCDFLAEIYLSSENLFFGGSKLLSLKFKENINSVFYLESFPELQAYENFFQKLGNGNHNINCYPYNFVEKILLDKWTLFRVFEHILPGKKVLVISPFADSIQKNFVNRKNFFKNYEYPDFSLSVYNTPVTYQNLPEEFYPDEDWFETAQRMANEITNFDFDIALLSCGSYALPLGNYIQKCLKRDAIYVGGVLQLYFGIMGRRYENTFFTGQMNTEYFIYPVEREKFLQHINISVDTAREAFGAYF
jgi:hypothetical protein